MEQPPESGWSATSGRVGAEEPTRDANELSERTGPACSRLPGVWTLWSTMAELRRVAHRFLTQRVVDSRHEDANLLRLSAPLPYGVGIGIGIDVAETHADVDTDSDPDPDYGRDLELGCGRQSAPGSPGGRASRRAVLHRVPEAASTSRSAARQEPRPPSFPALRASC
jgi:hypothetical protein